MFLFRIVSMRSPQSLYIKGFSLPAVIPYNASLQELHLKLARDLSSVFYQKYFAVDYKSFCFCIGFLDLNTVPDLVIEYAKTLLFYPIKNLVVKICDTMRAICVRSCLTSSGCPKWGHATIFHFPFSTFNFPDGKEHD